MNKVKYSNLTRIIAFLLQEILVVTTVVLAFYLGNTMLSLESVKEAMNGKSFLESEYFREQFFTQINHANRFMECQKNFEVAGAYNENKEVTISEFLHDDSDSSLYSRAQSYKLKELVDWSQEEIETIPLYEALQIKLFDSEKESKSEYTSNTMDAVIIVESDVAMDEGVKETTDDIDSAVKELKRSGVNITTNIAQTPVIKESYQTKKITLLDFYLDINDFTEIEKASLEIQEALRNVNEKYAFYKQYEAYFKSMDSSNFKIYIQDYKGEVILNNCVGENTNYEEYFASNVNGGVIYNAVNNQFTFTDFINDDVYSKVDIFKIPDQVNYIYAVGIDGKYPHNDEFMRGDQSFSNNRNGIIVIILSLILILICFIYLVAVCGRSTKDDEIHLNSFDKIKTEIGAGIMIALGIIVILIMDWVIIYFINSYIAMVGWICVETSLFTLGFLSLVKRIKAGQIWKNSLVYTMIQWGKIFFWHRKVTTRIAIIYSAYLVINLGLLGVSISSGSFFVLLMWFAFAGIVGFVLLKEAVARQNIMNGIEKITGGDLQYKIDTTHLKGSNEMLANAINNIGEGLHNAVDESMRNERLKTDLITNVSHDIKTPLTSIINYVDLIRRENIENEKIKGYIDILDMKSQRLKNLTEDLVEASKISSGNIKLEMTKINFVELINQTEGEFSEKFEAKCLQVITTLPIDIDTVSIYADGRRIWRVVENLFNNVAKYAMENTRVYVDLKTDKNNVIFSIKNISEHPLNINADELTERFIRGDVSRSTEGSGLGLSIAKNLTTLQKGTFEIYLDGDLFRVTITFPKVE